MSAPHFDDVRSNARRPAHRQIRNQHDRDSTFGYQFEPVWKFAIGPMTHTLVTGFKYVHDIVDTQRMTAD